MARPRVARNAEQAAKIPIEQPIQIEIPPEGEVIVHPDKPNQQSTGQQPVPPSTPPLAPHIQIDTKQDDSEVTSLKAQLDQLKRTSEDNARRAQEAAAREEALRRQFEDQGRNFQTAVNQRGRAEFDAISNGIMAAQAEVDAATQEMGVYGDAQDWGGMAKAQSRLARAQTRMVQLEDAKANFEARLEQIKQQPPQQQQFGDPVENHIAAMTGVNNAQKEWLRAHPETISDPEKNSYLRAAHYKSQRENISAGSPEYFKFIEEQLGYRQSAASEPETDELPPQVVAAPPSREAPSATGRTTPTRVTLTAEERQIAAASGISEIEYARNKLKLMEMKRAGQYRDGG
jgi:hypothetical protein